MNNANELGTECIGLKTFNSDAYIIYFMDIDTCLNHLLLPSSSVSLRLRFTFHTTINT